MAESYEAHLILPATCWSCGSLDWIGRQEVTPPSEWPFVWHRRTWCRYCDVAQDEVRSPGLMAITSRTREIDLRGSNPFLTEAV